MRLLLCLLLSLMALPASPQTPLPVLTYGDSAYFWSKPEQISAADVTEIAASPNGRYLLFLRHTPVRESFARLVPANPASPQTILCLYDARRKQMVSLWKITGERESRSEESVTWLADGETAIVVASRGDRYPEGTFADDTGGAPRYTTQLLIVDAPHRKVKVVTLEPQGSVPPVVMAYPTPDHASAVLYISSQDSPFGGELRFVQAAGISAPFPVDKPIARGAWNTTGTIWAAQEYSDAPDGIGAKSYVLFDRTKNALLTRQPEPKDKRSTKAATPPSPQSFVNMRTATGSMNGEMPSRPVSCVVLDAGDPAEKVILASDAEAVCMMGGDSPVAIYRTNDALFAASSYRVSYAEYVVAMRRSITANVRQIDSAIEQWMLDNKSDIFPKSPDAATLLVGDGKSLYMKRDYVFRDPQTGAFAFQNIFTGLRDATGKTPRFALQTTFGKVTMYTDDSPPVWEPVEPPTIKPKP